jgi:hypothetical protein
MKKTNIKGTTLIEIILYLGLLSIFLFVLLDIFIGGINIGLASKATSSVQIDSQFIFTRLMHDIEEADSVTKPVNLGDSSSSLTLVSAGVTYQYFLTNGNLTLLGGGQTLSLNNSDTTISNLNFTKLGNLNGKPTIKIKYTVNSITKVPTRAVETHDMETTISLR